ncbi:chitobiosyldiphosphodolichol beta-mannosyltransferase [Aplysia californica]|uniref:Beta-1,4-mannosyltransferase n=1 Tax=Aplysia californica TaxID=6500 RepID=A0ABM1A8P4_APLCA|nr:chitobiosyldiphosphodolichol beta-mannosyltransferase [Aplysia californica]
MSFALPILFYTPFVFIFLYLLVNFIVKTPRHVCIVVLGDIGRSPRMLYHALSFAQEGFKVYLVGYKGSVPPKKLVENENIELHYVTEAPNFFKYYPKIFQYFLKVIWQSLALSWTLLLLPKMGSYFLQNPPSIPTMAVAYVVSRVRCSELVIDWHNYGHTILAMALKSGHPMVRFAEQYEKICGRLSAYNICVTKAMKKDLQQNWNIKATTVYDRPPENFCSVSPEEQHELFVRLAREYPVFADRSGNEESTVFTQRSSSGEIVSLDKRPALLVSSTSWTEDEDFGILLEALKDYDLREAVPNLICVITGKGPQKEFYSKQIKERQWEKVQFCLPWLAAEDYPLLLGSADIGVCLHMSSSGLDLPMKVVDMFGCGLPVCAVKFECIDELVKHDVNGLIFRDSSELLTQLQDLLGGFPSNQGKLSTFRKNLELFQSVRWHDQWKQLVLPIFEEIGATQKPSQFRVQTGSGIPENFDDIGSEDGENSGNVHPSSAGESGTGAAQEGKKER